MFFSIYKDLTWQENDFAAPRKKTKEEATAKVTTDKEKKGKEKKDFGVIKLAVRTIIKVDYQKPLTAHFYQLESLCNYDIMPGFAIVFV